MLYWEPQEERKKALPMKIVILTAATGGGHLRAAHAMEEGLLAKTRHQAVTVDALKAVGPAFDKLICGSYLFMARHCPALFGRLYQGSNRSGGFSRFVPWLISRFSKGLLRTLERERPDAVITTHPFAATMCGFLRRKGKLTVPALSVITDYGAHRAYTAPGLDGYIVACDDMVQQLAAWGFPAETVHPFGIPVHRCFFPPFDPGALRQELGLRPDLPTVLFMAGSFGVSNIIGLYRTLAKAGMPLQLIVITGRNRKLYDRFEREIAQSGLPTQLILFTDEVEKYMHAADLLVTKPGGLTVSEALASGLPLAAFDAIPGQEEDNAAFLERHGMAIRLKKDSDFAGEIAALLGDPERLAAMRRACEAFDRSRCVEETAALLEELTAK